MNKKGLNSDFSVLLKWFCENALITSHSVKGWTEFSKLTFVCSEGRGIIRHTSRCFPKTDPRGFPRSLEFQPTDVFLAPVYILSQYSWVFSIEVREMLPILPNVFRISFSETTLCLALLSLLSMPFKYTPPRQDCIAGRPVDGPQFSIWQLLLGLSYQLLPLTARGSPSDCMCPFLVCKE